MNYIIKYLLLEEEEFSRVDIKKLKKILLYQ